MKIAILGTLKLTTNYRDWYTCFRRQLREVLISEILITGGNTVLNRYAKHYAKSMAIPIKEYHIDESSDYKSAKLIRNERIIRDADLVVACVDEYPLVYNCEVDKASVSNNRAIVINVSNYIHQSKLINDMKEMQEVTREELITLED